MTFSKDDNTPLEEIASLLKTCDSFVICGHVNPDGDCIGSMLALSAALKALGKSVQCVNASSDALPYSLSFLPGTSDLICSEDVDLPCKTFIAVDVSDITRFGNGAKYYERAQTTFILDHHACESRIADYSYIDPDSPSASMIIWKLAKILCAIPPTDAATCAYTGLLTDTGGFRFQNTNAQAFEAASEMVSYGADPGQIATEVFQNQSLASLFLSKIAIDHMDAFANNAAVMTYISRKDMDSCNATKSDTDHLIDIIRSIRGVRVACTLREQEDSIKGSLRAKDNTDVASLARTLNGGGHKAAAGFTLYMPLEDAIPFMKQKIEALLSKNGD